MRLNVYIFFQEPDSSISSIDDIDDDANEGIQGDSEHNNIILEENVIPETQNGICSQSENMEHSDDGVELQNENQVTTFIEKPQFSEKRDAEFKRPKKK